jgi:nucleoside phosphorylase
MVVLEGGTMEKRAQSFDVCIVCALPEEVRAFLEIIQAHSQSVPEERFSARYGYSYRFAMVRNHKGELLSLHVSWLPRYGPQEMTLHLSRVMEECQPRIAIMTGICAGDSQQVKLGDLVVAERIFTYDNGKFTLDEHGRSVHLHDTMTYQLDANILQFLGLFDEWKPLVANIQRPLSLPEQRETVCHLKAMASSSAVRADHPFEDVRRPVRGTVAIDMEGAAFGLVMSRHPLIRWLIVKGVGDYADRAKSDAYHDYAACASALYALSFIQNYVSKERLPAPPPCEVLILTALQVEYRAVVHHLQELQEVIHPLGTIYLKGSFHGEHRTWRVAVAGIGTMSSISVALEAERAINFFQPQIVLFVGVAGGFKDVKIGDVVAATRVYAYEVGKAAQHFEPRPQVWRASHALEQRARAEALRKEWLDRLDRPLPDPLPQVLIGPLAAGEKLVAFSQAGLYRFLKTTYADVLAIETEGYGFLGASNVDRNLQSLVIRGISDLLDEESAVETSRSQEKAAQHAAAFAFQIISKSEFIKFATSKDSSPSLTSSSDLLPSLTLYYVYSYEDKLLREKLEEHLISLSRLGIISSWHDREINTETEWVDTTNQHVETASVILLLVSPDFLSSGYSYGTEMRRALQRHSRAEARVIPILLRPVAWRESPVASLLLLPRNGKPITLWDDPDDAFLEILRSIRQICNEFLLLSRRQSSHQEASDIQYHPAQIYPLYDVFVKSGTPTVTFVEPTDFEMLKQSLTQPGRGLVIEGPSGVGKTTAIQKAIEYLANHHFPFQKKLRIQSFTARDPNHRRRLQTLRQWHKGTVVIDDFQRLDSALRQDIVDYLKYLADTSSRHKKLVVIGIPCTGQTLVDVSFDIATRIDVFQFGHVSDDLILQMVEKGEIALNIFFDRKVEIALKANGSLNIAQFLCSNLCQIAHISETCTQLKTIPYDFDIAQSLILKDLSRKFGEPVRRFASMGGPRNSLSLLLLEEVTNSEDGFLSLPHLKNKKPDLAQRLQQFLTEDWMGQLYREYPECQQHFFFDNSIQALVIDDPQLVFYLRQLRFSTLAKEAGKVATLVRRKVFISYSHKDTRWLNRLRIHLKPIEREGIIDLWDDTKIAAGVQWKGAIFEALETSKVAVLLISPDFLASDFIAEHELPTLLTQAASGETVVIPIIVSPCLFQETALSTFQAVNSPKKPLSTLSTPEREQVLVNVAEAIIQHLAGVDRNKAEKEA